ncbi:MAG: LysR family glycine cleavage system transcriptional activator [Gammaproteobacteria bacterium]|jgi:LysR family glycine cleavage system transcriptional activator
MQSRLPNLVWLRTFEAAARLLNFTQAGAELGLTQTAVSQHIKALEAVLGCQLFERKPRHLALTGMGQAYVHSVRKSLADINLSTTSLFGSLSQQTITVRAPISTVALWLAPLLPQFTALYPEINIRFISIIWADSVLEDNVDVDLRIGYGDWPGLQVEKISQETIVPICAEATLPLFNHPADLLDSPLIHILGHEDNWARFFSANDLSMDNVQMKYSVDTSIAALALVSAGVGAATILTRFAKTAIESGSKIDIVAEPIYFPQSHYLTHSLISGPQRPEVELFKTWLKLQFEDK